MTIGIYCLRFEGTEEVYIGQSENIERRFKEHSHSFNNGRASSKLKLAQEMYGMPSLQILCICNLEELSFKEDLFIQQYNALEKGFNTLGSSTPLNNFGDRTANSHYSNETIIKVFKLLVHTNNTAEDISIELNVSIHVVRGISTRKSHKWLKITFPEEYLFLENKRYARKTLRRLEKTYPQLKSPSGILYTFNDINKFSQENGIRKCNLQRLINGIGNSCQGWTLV